ncbi:hypothetical protein OSTOST_14922 [Ostertagia ostertagi]
MAVQDDVPWVRLHTHIVIDASDCPLPGSTAASLMAVVGWMMLYFWYAFFNSFDLARPFPFDVRMVNCLNPDIAMAYGIPDLRRSTVGNDFTPPTPDQRLTVGHCFIMLIVDGLLLMIITWYVEAVYPGGEGVPQKPWFFLLATINVVGLSKTYGTSIFKKLFDCQFGKLSEKKAVDDLNLKMYHGSDHSLTRTQWSRKKHDIQYADRTSLPQVRKQTGLCPQYNILFNSLTVMEHLEFFCKLKGREYFEKGSHRHPHAAKN